jgi:hypothetical protein
VWQMFCKAGVFVWDLILEHHLLLRLSSDLED